MTPKVSDDFGIDSNKLIPKLDLTASNNTDIQNILEPILERLRNGEVMDPCQVIIDHPSIAPELERRLNAAMQLFNANRVVCSEAKVRHEIPQSIGRFRVKGILGRGGSAVVYRAFDPKLDRDVALKVISVGPNDGSSQTERFARVARAQARLRHTNIVPLHETGEADGLHFLNMELIEGETLDVRLRHPPELSFTESARLVHMVAQALHFAHEHGVIHRDIKPSNILIDANGEPQVTDFGLARRIDVDQTLTVAGDVLCTPAYMPPEQASGKSHEADARSDVYSLGAVLYRMTTGQLPFEGTDSWTSLQRRIADDDPPAPRSIRANIPRDLETICLRAMEKQQADRFASAGAMGAELWRWLNDETLTIRRPSVWERARRWARRRRLMAASLLSLSGLTVLCATLGWTAWNLRTRAELALQSEALEKEYRAKAEIRSLLDQCWQRVRSPAVGRRFETQKKLRDLAQHRRLIKDAEELERIDLEARSVFAATLGVPEFHSIESVELPESRTRLWPVAIRPDGQGIAISTKGRPVTFRRGQSQNLSNQFEVSNQAPPIAFSPDGTYFVGGTTDGQIAVWNDNCDQLVKSLKLPNGLALAIGFANKSTILRTICSDGTIRSWTIPSFDQLPDRSVPNKVAVACSEAQFTRDGSTVALGYKNGHVYVFDLNTSTFGSMSDSEMRLEPLALAWSPDNQLVAIANKGGSIRIFRKDGELLRRFKIGLEYIASIGFASDGKWLLAGAPGIGTRAWDVATGELVLTHPGIMNAISENGQIVVLNEGEKLTIAEVNDPNIIRTLRGHSDGIASCKWAGDSRRLATIDSALNIRVWDVTNGRVIDEFIAPVGDLSAGNGAIALNDDGTRLAYASGGRSESRVLIRDVETKKQLDEWKLSGGFEYLAYVNDGKFRLVREELLPESRTVRTVIHHLMAGQPLDLGQRLQDGDIGLHQLFLNAQLTPDGRFYCWIGPRHPSESRRVEVWNVADRKIIYSVKTPANNNDPDPVVVLEPGGQQLWVSDAMGSHRFDFVVPKTSKLENVAISGVSANMRWQILQIRNPKAGDSHIQVWEFGNQKGRIWIDGFEYPLSCHAEFNRDGSRVAWGTASGRIYVADLQILKLALDAFDADFLAIP